MPEGIQTSFPLKTCFSLRTTERKGEAFSRATGMSWALTDLRKMKTRRNRGKRRDRMTSRCGTTMTSTRECTAKTASRRATTMWAALKRQKWKDANFVRQFTDSNLSAKTFSVSNVGEWVMKLWGAKRAWRRSKYVALVSCQGTRLRIVWTANCHIST